MRLFLSFVTMPLTCLYICAEAKQDLVSYVAFVKDVIADPGRNLTKEEKVTHFLTSGFNMLLWEQLEREWQKDNLNMLNFFFSLAT